MRVLILALVAALVASGCAEPSSTSSEGHEVMGDESNGSGSQEDPILGENQSAPVRLVAVGCAYVEFGFAVEPDRAAEWVPDGFAVSTVAGVYGVVEANQLTCERITVGNTTVYENYSEATVHILVEPPEEVAPPSGVRSTYLVTRWSTADEAFALILPEATADFRKGGSEFLVTDVAADQGVLAGSSATGDEGESWHYTLLVDKNTIDRGESVRVFYSKESGTGWFDEGVEGRFNAKTYAGEVELQDGSILQQVIGRQTPEAVLSDFGVQVSKNVMVGA